MLEYKQQNFLMDVLISWRAQLQWQRNLRQRCGHFRQRVGSRQVREIFEAWARRWYDADYVQELHVQLRLHWQALDRRDAEIEHLQSLVEEDFQD